MSIYFDLQNNPIITTSSSLTVPKITGIAYPGDDTAADTAGGQTITITGSGFNSGASVIINGSAVGVVTVLNSTTITFVSPAQSTGSYPLYVINSDGGTGVAVPGIQYSGTPVWSTAAGSLGSYVESQSIANTVTATGDAPVTYSLYSGTLPTGATLNTSNGYISGTSPAVGGATTYTFTIRATDAQQQDTNRSFNLTINPDVVTWSSPANNATYTAYTNQTLPNVSLSASASSGQGVVYTANSLPTGLSLSGSNISGVPTVGGNSSTLLTATANVTGKSATDTINWVIYANDSYFKYVSLLLSASNSPSSTFVSDASANSYAITINGDTRPNKFNPYTPGYYSNLFDGSGDYLSMADSALWILGNNFTIECWVYFTSSSGIQQFVTQRVDSSNCWQFLYNWPSSGDLTFKFADSNVAINRTWNPTINTWYHISVCRNGSTWYLFVNGTQLGVTATNSTSFPDIGAALEIGRIPGGEYFAGYMSNLRIVTSSLYTSNFTPSTTPLTAVANTILLTCQSNNLLDNSTNNVTITKNGDVTVLAFNPFNPYSSYSTYGSGYFDGTGDYCVVASSSNLNSTANWSVEAWFYPTALASNNDYNIIYGPLSVYTESGQCYIVFWSSGGGTSQVGIGTATQTLNRWMHLAYVNTASTNMKVYFNGTQIINRGAETITMGTTYIGANSSGGQRWNGYISGLRVRNNSATPTYTANFTPPSSPFTSDSYTQLLTLQNNQPTSNSMFVDTSALNNLWTRNGNATQGSFSPYSACFSNYFDGTGDYLTATMPSAIGTNSFTIEGWIYPTAYPSNDYSMIVDNRNSGTNNGVSVMYNQTTGYWSYFDGNTLGVVSSTTAISLNTWSHFALVRSSTTWKLFVNGTQVISDQTSSSNIGSTTVYIATARDNPGNTRLVTGYLSNIRILNGTALYTTTFTPPSAPLTPITYTVLLTCQSYNFVDNSPNNLTITRYGDTSVKKISPFSMTVPVTPTSYSVYFDGTGDYLTTSTFGAGAGSGLFTTGATFTIEAWLFQTSYQTSATYLNCLLGDLTPTSDVALWWAVGTNSGNAPIFQWYDGSVKTYLGNTALATNTWNHVAFVCNAGTLSIYVNGIVQTATGTSTISTPAGTQSSLTIAADRGHYVTGYISNLRVVKNTAVYTTNFTPPTSPLTAIANTQLLTCQSTTLIDNSSNAFIITQNGDAKPMNLNPFGYTVANASTYLPSVQGGSMYFDGTGDYLSTGNTMTLFVSNENWSIEAWVYTLSLPTDTYKQFFGSSQFSFGTYGSVISITNNNTGQGFGVGITTGQWYHLAVVNKASSYMKLYVNGVEAVSTTAATYTWNTSYGSTIGSNIGGSQPFTGYLADVRINRNTTNPTYSSNFIPPTSPLSALPNTTVLVNGNSAGMYDSTMMTILESAGDSRISTSLVKYGNSSMYFDGTGDYLTTSLNMPYYTPGTADFTIEFWAYTDTNNKGIMSCFTQGSYDGWAVNIVSGGFIWYAGNGSGVEYQLAYKTANFTGNTWNFVTCVKSGTTCTIYLNGVAATPYGISQITQGSTLYIGAGSFLSSNAFQAPSAYSGYLCDVRITKGVARYSSNFSVPTTPFITF